MTKLREVKKAVRPHLHVVGQTGRTDEPKISAEAARDGLILPDRGERLLRAQRTEGQDRSARLYELGALLTEAGAEPEATFVLLQSSAWNKFKGRDDEAERLWEAIDRAADALDRKGHARNGRPRGSQNGVKAIRVDKLLARDLPQSEWCIDSIWENKGWGFVAGEPKTYKSTFTTDLAVSLATATPFLGEFEVVKPGPVLIIQEENTENIQWARLRRILRHRNLGGKFHSFREGILEFTPPSSDTPIYCLDRSRFSFTNTKKRRAVEADIRALEPRMVVFDPLQRMLGELSIRNENDVTKVLDWLDYINQSYKTGIMVVHHYHKRREEGPVAGGQRMLGSQALHAWLSCGLYVERIEGHHLRVNREFRAFADGGPFELEFQSEDDQDFYHVDVKLPKKGKADELLDIVSDRPGLTVEQVAKLLGVSRSTMSDRAHRHEGIELRQSKSTHERGGRRRTTLWVRGSSGA